MAWKYLPTKLQLMNSYTTKKQVIQNPANNKPDNRLFKMLNAHEINTSTSLTTLWRNKIYVILSDHLQTFYVNKMRTFDTKKTHNNFNEYLWPSATRIASTLALRVRRPRLKFGRSPLKVVVRRLLWENLR